MRNAEPSRRHGVQALSLVALPSLAVRPSDCLVSVAIRMIVLAEGALKRLVTLLATRSAHAGALVRWAVMTLGVGRVLILASFLAHSVLLTVTL